MLNHDQVAIAAQLIADVDHLARPGGIHRLAAGSGDINAFIAAIGGGIRQDTLPLVGQRQQRCPTGGQED